MVTVHDVLAEDDDPYIVMEPPDGRSLQRHPRESGPLTAEHAERPAGSMLRALGAAHDPGVIHRDVEPANIMLTVSAGEFSDYERVMAEVVDSFAPVGG